MVLVDDDTFVRRALQRTLSRARPWSLRLATSAEQAREALQAEGADVVVTDLRMPGEGGVALLRWLAANAPEVVRVVHSAYLPDLAGHEALAQVKIQKPATVADLLAGLDAAAALARGSAPPESGVCLDRSCLPHPHALPG